MSARVTSSEQCARPFLCPACGAMMYRARLLKGYRETDVDPERLTCALHGPLGRFRHIATDEVKGRRP